MQTNASFNGQPQRGARVSPVEATEFESIATPYGSVRVNLGSLMLGELLVSDEGAELEVVGLDPLELVLAPEEEEDWGE